MNGSFSSTILSRSHQPPWHWFPVRDLLSLAVRCERPHRCAHFLESLFLPCANDVTLAFPAGQAAQTTASSRQSIRSFVKNAGRHI